MLQTQKRNTLRKKEKVHVFRVIQRVKFIFPFLLIVLKRDIFLSTRLRKSYLTDTRKIHKLKVNEKQK